MVSGHIPWHKNKALFERELRDGIRWQNYVGEKMEELGYSVAVSQMNVVGSMSDAKKYKDVADIIAEKDGIKLIVEVKSRRSSFTCPEDYRWPSVFVDTKSGYDAKEIKPDLHLVVSRVTGRIIGLPRECESHWGVERVFDRIRKIWVTNYAASKERWMPFEMAVKEAHGQAKEGVKCQRQEGDTTLTESGSPEQPQ